jgi:DNA-binding NarL/FixJ family response regulator
MQVLALIPDGEALPLEDLFEGFEEPVFELRRVSTQHAAYELLGEGNTVLVLLDLSHPEHGQMELLSHLHDDFPEIPAIVLAPEMDRGQAQQAIALGAHDYLVHDGLSPETLEQSVRFALRRHSLLQRAGEMLEQRLRERELDAFDQLRPQRELAVTRSLMGIEHLQQRDPEAFQRLREHYETLLEKALEAQRLKTDFDVNAEVKNFADQLGHLLGGPRDLVEIHTAALKARLDGANARLSRAMTEEGRFLIIRALGALSNFYRLRATGLSH